jgi:hypothetical protein
VNLARMLYANPYGRMPEAPLTPPDPDPVVEHKWAGIDAALDAIHTELPLSKAERSWLEGHLDTLLATLIDRRAEDGA